MYDLIRTKNKRTGEIDIIKMHDIMAHDWGFSFFVDSEADAYKAFYQYRNNIHGAELDFDHDAQRWIIRVFNENG